MSLESLKASHHTVKKHTHIPCEVVFNTYIPFTLAKIESFLVITNFTSQNTLRTNVASEMTADLFLILFTDCLTKLKWKSLSNNWL